MQDVLFEEYGLDARAFWGEVEARHRALTAEGYRAHWHPLTTGLFILACAVIVASTLWTDPKDSLIGYAIMLAGVPAYYYFTRQKAPETPPPS